MFINQEIAVNNIKIKAAAYVQWVGAYAYTIPFNMCGIYKSYTNNSSF